jgi:hypothetical protein
VNFLAHARASLDEPWVLAGVCLPDWLRVIDRRGRVDLERVDPNGRDARDEQLREGVRRHLHDDAWFHATPVFEGTLARLARRMRAEHEGVRASFYAHILLELLLDAALMERDPELADRFYAQLEEIPPDELASRAAPMLHHAEHVLEHFPALFRRFRDVRFIEGYATDEGVLRSLRGLTTRLKQRGRGMAPLPDAFTDTIAWARGEVAAVADALLEENP